MNNTATEKQIAFINTLKSERDIGDEGEQILRVARELWDRGAFDVAAASAVIEGLKSLPRTGGVPYSKEPPPEGIHELDGEVYKVVTAVHGSGKRYAKRLLKDDGDWSWVMAPGYVNKLSEGTLMSIERARTYGRLYGHCVVCGRTLTDEKSIAAGIGPVCAGKWQER